MKGTRNYNFIFVLGMFILIMIYNPNSSTPIYANNHYIDHERITIDGDMELEEIAVKEGWSGIGTSDDPYIIEGLRIKKGLSNFPSRDFDYSLISIKGTTYYIEIRNNYLEGGDVGVFLTNVSNITITNSEIKNNLIGIYVVDSEDIFVNNNIISDSLTPNYNRAHGYTISVLRSVSINIWDNEIFNSAREAIIGIEINKTNIWDNNIRSNPGGGVEIFRSFNINIASNNINGGNGVSIVNSRFVNIQSNIIYNNSVGIRLWVGPLDLDIILENVDILDNQIYDNDVGIYTNDVGNILISGNLISENKGNGIQGDLHNGMIKNNEISNNIGFGLSLSEDLMLAQINGISSNIDVTQNNFINNNLQGSTQASEHSKKSNNNTFNYNYWNDWITPDVNNDGYVDRPYFLLDELNQTALSADNFPVKFKYDLNSLSTIDSSELIFPNFKISNLQLITLTVGLLIGSNLILFQVRRIRKSKNILLNDNIIHIIKEGFGILSQSVFILLGSKSSYNYNIPEEDILLIEKSKPEILKFKFLLHPVRLSLMKLLSESSPWPSSELRELLGITWGELSTHIDALIKKGYVSKNYELSSDLFRNVIHVENLGISRYTELYETIQSFLQS